MALHGFTSFYYTLPWIYHGFYWLSVVATMVIVAGPHPLRARTASQPSKDGYIACSTNFLHYLLRRSEVSRTFERTSTQELLFFSSIELNNLAVQNESSLHESYFVPNWTLVYCAGMILLRTNWMLVYYAGIFSAFSHCTNLTVYHAGIFSTFSHRTNWTLVYIFSAFSHHTNWT